MLTDLQKESEPMKDLKIDLRIETGTIIYTASTMQEQRDIAEYINSIDGGDYEIIDFSQKEQHPSNKPLYTDNSKVIIVNMQELGLAPYGKPDDKATITLQDKIEWANRRMKSPIYRSEGQILQSCVEMRRDNFFLCKKVICGMHPNFRDKMDYRPQYDYVDDWLSCIFSTVRFNEHPEFVQSLPLTDFTDVRLHDMIFAFKNKLVRWPDFHNCKIDYTDLAYNEMLSQLPELALPSRKQEDREKE